MSENKFNSTLLLDSLSNIHNAIAAIKSAAIDLSSDSITGLQHAAEGVLKFVEAELKEGTATNGDEAFVRIGCLADLIETVNLNIDDQLLHAACVLLHLANEQLGEERAATA